MLKNARELISVGLAKPAGAYK